MEVFKVLRELSLQEVSEVAGGEPGQTFVTTLCGGVGYAVGSLVAGTAGGILGGAVMAAYCDSLMNSKPATEPDINRLSPSEIKAVYSRSVYMDGHEIRNGDPYDRWP